MNYINKIGDNLFRFLSVIITLVVYNSFCFAQPANDNCSGAITLVSTAECTMTSGTTASATQSQSGCTGTANDDVWYRFKATATSQSITVIPSSGFNAVYQVFSGTCGGTLTSMDCVNDNNSNGQREDKLITGFTINTFYYIRV